MEISGKIKPSLWIYRSYKDKIKQKGRCPIFGRKVKLPILYWFFCVFAEEFWLENETRVLAG